mmetsp:Transcript_131743/g.381009  ORF Transcript_131743/g.381009 Transcript_131743/m.381009 type:complete len:248 (-) Transcript_131743:33-776(-)
MVQQRHCLSLRACRRRDLQPQDAQRHVRGADQRRVPVRHRQEGRVRPGCHEHVAGGQVLGRRVRAAAGAQRPADDGVLHEMERHDAGVLGPLLGPARSFRSLRQELEELLLVAGYIQCWQEAGQQVPGGDLARPHRGGGLGPLARCAHRDVLLLLGQGPDQKNGDRARDLDGVSCISRRSFLQLPLCQGSKPLPPQSNFGAGRAYAARGSCQRSWHHPAVIENVCPQGGRVRLAKTREAQLGGTCTG